MDESVTESLAVLVEVSEDGVRRVNKFLDSGWVWVEGFTGKDGKVLAVLGREKPEEYGGYGEGN